MCCKIDLYGASVVNALLYVDLIKVNLINKQKMKKLDKKKEEALNDSVNRLLEH